MRSVSLVVAVANDAELPLVMEVMARHCAGLVMEGVDSWIQVETVSDEESEGDADV